MSPDRSRRKPRLADDPKVRALLQAHGRREHVGLPRLDCPACRKFPKGAGR